MRTVPLWVATHDDQAIPKAVKLRIWNRCGGRCALTGKKLLTGEPFDYDHIKPLWAGGRHSEDNLHVVAKDAHRVKTAAEAGSRAKADRQRAKFLGIWPKSPRPLRGRPFPKRGMV